MSGKTFVEKALARAAGVSEASAGDILDVRPDLIFSHDNSAAIRRIFEKIGAKNIARPDRVAITLDHAVPAPTTQHAQNHAEIREWIKQQSIQHFFEVGRGICHQVISEEALILPGETILGADSHSTHFGWLGAFGAGVGRTEMAALWATGELWLRVPEAMRVTLTGRLQSGVTAKDISLRILGDMGVEGGLYRSVEFAGDTLSTLSLDERPILPNVMAEFGAKNAYMPPDDMVFNYLEARRTRDYTPLYPDPDAHYEIEYALDVSQLEPQIALPHQPDNVVRLSDAIGEPVQQAFIGTCTNGRLEDLQAAADVLRGHQVACRLVVIPASSQVLLEATRSGIIETLLMAGATIATPGCGPCMGNHMGIPAPNEATVSSANRNFKGRMGTPEAPVYLASPYVVAASAICGAIADPREFLS
ncbi:MAG: 3-isopropylmalate dehydratase large subunit [Chloroflexota bacterium]|nr:3-isopropylmalate dehydratase large subunit [Chloroflexota bacterium]NOG63239.1 3-isopropylmalate dehydratase large subunit [Chloroflexota bacterium]GIK64497.1 MAG: 3-isopropylmalate dehydratase large subunit [Chloroflexota bacterium]